MHETHIRQWGNSLAVRLPKEVVEKLELKENARVVIKATKTGIVVRPKTGKDDKLEQLLRDTTPERYRKQVDWSPAGDNES